MVECQKWLFSNVTLLIHKNHGWDPWIDENILHRNDIHVYVKYDGAISLRTHTFNTKAEVC